MLNFVKEYIRHAVLQDKRLYVGIQIVRIAKLVVVVILKVKVYNLVVLDSIAQEPVAENLHNS